MREKRPQPFFDDKTQIDLNSFWLSTLIFIAEVLDDENWREIAKSNYKLIKNLTNDGVYHCYKNKNGVKVFLEDYTYLAQLMINLYEVTGEIIFLSDAKIVMKKTWDLFYDKNNKILQKNPIDENDLFAPPIDMNDHNIPNGNNVFLINCKKLELITEESDWKDMSKELIQSFHSYLNLHASQMISYTKNLDMCEDQITFTFFGDLEKNKDLHKFVKRKYLKSSFIIYKKNPEDNYLIICKKQTCSNKIKNIDELKSFVKNYAI